MTNSSLLTQFAQQRDQLLEHITTYLSRNPRFKATWLSGSFGRDDADEVSDLDITAVVSQDFVAELCARPNMITTHPPAARLDLFAEFGEIGFAYENNHNATDDSTFTTISYAQSGIIVDWLLIPEETAQRPEASHPLFSHIEIPVIEAPSPATPAERAKAAADSIGFFWLMATVTAKYLIRNDLVFAMRWLDELAGMVSEIKRQLAGEPWQYQRGSHTHLRTTKTEQLAFLRELCQQIEALSPAVTTLGGDVWPSAPESVAQWLDLVEK
jgi:hypothetical protein